MLLSEKLKKLRGNRTQGEIAKNLDISRARYSHYENDLREPDNEMLMRIADLYGVSVDYLLGNETSKNKDSFSKDEKDIAKRLEDFKREIENSDGLAFSGEPLSDEAKESLVESMKFIFEQTQRINKKYTPKKHRTDQDEY